MVEKPVVIVGGGIAGLAVAKTLLDSGLRCVIVEKAAELGGHVRNWACMATEKCQRCFCCAVEDLARDVNGSNMAEVLTGWEISSPVSPGTAAQRVSLRQVGTGTEEQRDAAALVLATGFEVYDPSEKVLWGYGRLPGVYTLAEVDSLLRQDAPGQFTNHGRAVRVAFFQCVGSRDAGSGANYCSRYCCKAALRMALKLIHECNELAVTIFYIDLQVAGKYAGELLKQAENINIRLLQGVPGEVSLSSGGSLEVMVEQHGKNIKESFDRVVLSTGQRPSKGSSSIARELGVPVNEFGFLEPKAVLDGSRTVIPGVYVAGTCSQPGDISQTLDHAGQTAQAVIADLRRGAQI